MFGVECFILSQIIFLFFVEDPSAFCHEMISVEFV